ncbi:MAG TPA: hypothetical protein VEB21_06475 [Terriglobales bacterium]|nr:hypothetical protein [Terriglobales bacterium]
MLIRLRSIRSARWHWGLLAVFASLAGAMDVAIAQPTHSQAASIVLLPRVRATVTHDTFVELANVSGGQTIAKCFYVNQTEADPRATTAFILTLTRNQPIGWRVSAGRSAGGDETDPGAIPAMAAFDGELICVELDVTHAPVSGNHLIAHATIAARDSGDIAKYSGIGLLGLDTNDADGNLCLGGGDCSFGAEYEGCPAAWQLDFLTEGSESPHAGSGSTVHTELTVTTCSPNLANGTALSSTVQFLVYNEYAQRFSTSASVPGWKNARLCEIAGGNCATSIFSHSVLSTTGGRARIAPAGSAAGIAIVAQEIHASATVAASAAANAHVQGTRSFPDLITLP